MSRSLFKFLVVVVLAVPLTVPVALAADLYVGEAVLDESGRIDDRALLRALDEVLVRLTGQVERTPVETLGIAPAEVHGLIQTRHTVQRELVDEAGEPVSELRVRAEFDEPAVNRLLRENGLPRWGRERPAVLLWVAMEDADGVAYAEDPWLSSMLDEEARRLGLDIVRPLGDALDMAEVTLPDIRGGFIDSAVMAAQRYGAGVIAMLDLRADSDADEADWSARWTWRVGQVDSGFQHSGERDRLVRRGLERIAAAMAERFAIRDLSDGGAVRRVVVDGILDDVHFAEVRRYLEGLSIVEDLRVVAARGRTLEFELALSGDGLEQFLEMGGLLVESAAPVGNTLHYRLRR